jgi:hypothetical protein
MERPGCSLLMATLAIGPRAVVRKDEEIDFMCCSNYLCLSVCLCLSPSGTCDGSPFSPTMLLATVLIKNECALNLECMSHCPHCCCVCSGSTDQDSGGCCLVRICRQ